MTIRRGILALSLGLVVGGAAVCWQAPSLVACPPFGTDLDLQTRVGLDYYIRDRYEHIRYWTFFGIACMVGGVVAAPFAFKTRKGNGANAG